jgi:phage-related protein
MDGDGGLRPTVFTPMFIEKMYVTHLFTNASKTSKNVHK